MRIVVDTNIVISAFLTENGRSRIFMNKVLADEYEVIVSESILREYERKLKHPKFALHKETIEFVLDWFREHALFVEVNEEEAVAEMESMDVTDKPFYLLARATKSLLVTGNIRHYLVEEWRTMLWELT